MDEKEIVQLMKNLDNDLLSQELEDSMGVLDIDRDSISRKAHWKLGKEKRKMKKRRFLTVAAAAVIMVGGVTTAYASELSDFVRGLFGKTGIYSTVVEGSSYYLESPVALGQGQSLSKAMFTADGLTIRVVADPQNRPDVKVRVAGEEWEAGGLMGEEDGMTLSFYDLPQAQSFELVVGGKSYPISLADGRPVTEGDFFEAEAGKVQWVSMGCKKVDGGVQILASFDAKDVQLTSLMLPESDKVTATFHPGGSNHFRDEFLPLMGYGQNGAAYQYRCDPNDMGHPLTVFTSDAPAGEEITLKVPGIAVLSTRPVANVAVELPEVGQTTEPGREIDLHLQSMTLQSVRRDSATTATLTFALNTGSQANVNLWQTYMDSPEAEKGDLLWQDDACTMTVAFPQEETQLNLAISNPQFLVNGDWEMVIGK